MSELPVWSTPFREAVGAIVRWVDDPHVGTLYDAEWSLEQLPVEARNVAVTAALDRLRRRR